MPTKFALMIIYNTQRICEQIWYGNQCDVEEYLRRSKMDILPTGHIFNDEYKMYEALGKYAKIKTAVIHRIDPIAV